MGGRPPTGAGGSPAAVWGSAWSAGGGESAAVPALARRERLEPALATTGVAAAVAAEAWFGSGVPAGAFARRDRLGWTAGSAAAG
jgi:hypothetical protein